jgi:hypothetical protein
MVEIHDNEEFFKIIEDYRNKHEYEISVLKDYVPTMPQVSFRKISVFRALIKLLTVANHLEIKKALRSSQDLCEGLDYDGKFIIKGERGNDPVSYIPFDERRLDAIVRKFVVLAEEQKNMSDSEMLDNMQQQQILVDDLFNVIRQLLILEKNTSLIAADKSHLLKRANRATREDLKSTASLIGDITGKNSPIDLHPEVALNQRSTNVLMHIVHKYAQAMKVKGE